MKDAKLACLKKRGRMPAASACGSHTTKLFPAPPGAHDTTASVAASATISYVFATNGAGSGGPSIDRGTTDDPSSAPAAHGSGFGSSFTAATLRAIATPPNPTPLARAVLGLELEPLGPGASGHEEEEAIWLRGAVRCGARGLGVTGFQHFKQRPKSSLKKFEKNRTT